MAMLEAKRFVLRLYIGCMRASTVHLSPVLRLLAPCIILLPANANGHRPCYPPDNLPNSRTTIYHNSHMAPCWLVIAVMAPL